MAGRPERAGRPVAYGRSMPSLRTLPARAVATFNRLGPSGIVLLAALVADLLLVLTARIPAGPALAQAVEVLALAGCVLWSRVAPLGAAFAGAGVLVVNGVLTAGANGDSTFRLFGDLAPYSLTPSLSVAEMVAGFLLVYRCVRRVDGRFATAATATLVIAALAAVFQRNRGSFDIDRGSVSVSLILGFALLVTAVGTARWHRRTAAPAGQSGADEPPAGRGAVTELVRSQWLLIGGLCLPLFFEFTTTLLLGRSGLPLFACSLVATAAAVYAARNPLVATLTIAGTILVGALVVNLHLRSNALTLMFGVSTSQAIAGAVAVAFTVRAMALRVAWPPIVVLAAAVAFAVISNPRRPDVLTSAIIAALVAGIAIATGLYLRSRDSERDKSVRTAVNDAQTAERMALARELHDVVAHHVTGIVVQAQAAQIVAGTQPDVARDALGRIEGAGLDALTAMRRLVRSMRGDAPAGSTEFTEQATTDLAADLRRLVEAANHGVPTEVSLEVPPGLPQEVARSALRIVQEALTNVGKHAAGVRLATVLVHAVGDQLHIQVQDNGIPPQASAAGPGHGGYGLVGMRERVDLLGGRLFVGPDTGGGWLVEAFLPFEAQPVAEAADTAAQPAAEPDVRAPGEDRPMDAKMGAEAPERAGRARPAAEPPTPEGDQ